MEVKEAMAKLGKSLWEISFRFLGSSCGCYVKGKLESWSRAGRDQASQQYRAKHAAKYGVGAEERARLLRWA